MQGSLETVNGRMTLEGAEVGDGISTVNGDIMVGTGSRVDGGIRVEKSSGWGWNWGRNKRPKVTIESGAVVNGTLEFEREVDLYVGEGVVLGEIKGVQPVRHVLK